MNNSNKVKSYIQKELQKGIETGTSWHNDYKDSAYIFVGGLNYDLNEADLSTVFSQWGQIVDVRLVRDNKTGKSKGFCFIAYEDQRSTVLAVENFNQIDLCGRTIGVNHVLKYRPPKEYFELKEDGTDLFDEENLYKPSGPDGRGWGEFREFTEAEQLVLEEEKKLAELATHRTEKAYENIQEIKKTKYFMDEDERWEQFLMEDMGKDTNDNLEKKINALKEKTEQMIKGKLKATKEKKSDEADESKEKKDKKEKKEKDKKDKKEKKEKKDKTVKKDKKIKKDKEKKRSSHSRSRSRS